jgi:hypothetical protein
VAFGIGVMGQLVGKLAANNFALIDAILTNKLEQLGENTLLNALAPLNGAGPAKRIVDAIESGGMSEIDKLGEEFLHKLTPKPGELGGRVLGIAGRYRIHGQHGPASSAAWARTDWATSRDDWLDNRWKHDWRSQPRDLRGRWIPGRLNYVPLALQYRGSRKGRVKRRKMRARAFGRLRARRLLGIERKRRRKAGAPS